MSASVLVMAYTMLQAANVRSPIGDPARHGRPAMPGPYRPQPAAVHHPAQSSVLAWLNYRGVLMTLNVQLSSSPRSPSSSILILFFVGPVGARAVPARHGGYPPKCRLPYGWIGVIAALHFGIWYYLGIEGTCQAAEEVARLAARCPMAPWLASSRC